MMTSTMGRESRAQEVENHALKHKSLIQLRINPSHGTHFILSNRPFA